jgi:hypothetical protein
LIAFMLIALVFLNGCMNLRIESDIDYPAGLFKETKKKIETIQDNDPHRKGEVSKINILVYDGEDRDLVQVSFKKNTAEKYLKEEGISSSSEGKKYSKKYANFDFEKIKDLDKIGPGLLIEVEELKEKSHVIIWLD